MIEVTPTTELPIWPAYLDGNAEKYEPQQLEYLDGNLHYDTISPIALEEVIIEETSINLESFNFEDNGQAIVTTNDIDFTVSGNTISYKGTGIDLGKAFQVIDELIIVKAKTPGFYVWTTPTDFGSFLVHQGVFKQNIRSRYLDSDFTFCLNYPRERDYTLVSQKDSRFKVLGSREGIEEKTSADRPLYFYKRKKRIPYSEDIIQSFKNNYPWKEDNGTVFINSKAERLKCFILKDNEFYWANLTFKEEYQTGTGFYPIDEKIGSTYIVTNLSYTEADRVLYYGDKLLIIKEYNKLLNDMV